MKRLCVFHRAALDWLGLKVEWIVCKECQKRLRRGEKQPCFVANHTMSCGYRVEQRENFGVLTKSYG
jgi:hypothetical protein